MQYECVLGALYLRLISTRCVPTFIVASVYIATDTIWEYPPASLYYFLIFKCVIKIVKSAPRARSPQSPACLVRKSRILQSGAAFQKSTAVFCLLSLITHANIDPNWPISGDLNEQINPHTAHVRCTKTTTTWHKRPRGISARISKPAKTVKFHIRRAERNLRASNAHAFTTRDRRVSRRRLIFFLLEPH